MRSQKPLLISHLVISSESSFQAAVSLSWRPFLGSFHALVNFFERWRREGKFNRINASFRGSSSKNIYPSSWRMGCLWRMKGNLDNVAFRMIASFAMLLCHDVQSNGNETWVQFVPEDEGKYWTSSRLVRVSQLSRKDSGQFVQIFNIKVSSFISNVAVVNTPCPTLWRQLFDIWIFIQKRWIQDGIYIYINILYSSHLLKFGQNSSFWFIEMSY